MNINIIDTQGLDIVLMMSGYSREQRQEAKQIIREQFRTACVKVFQEIMAKPLPDTVIVNMAINSKDEIKGESAARLASFNVELSRANSCYFTIREITVKTILEHKDTTLFESTVFHEMFHAADLSMLENNHRLFYAIQNDIYSIDSFDYYKTNAPIALLRTLQMFDHYRAEGIAILGESLLMKSKFRSTIDATTQFCSVFKLALMRSQMRINGEKNDGNDIDRAIFHTAYAVAPTILMLILDKRGDINHELVEKALNGLNSGCYELTNEDIETIMRSALALSLTEYIQGLICLGDSVAPIRPFLNFCSSYQEEWAEENITAFELLTQQPETIENFNVAMDKIIGCCIPENELDCLYIDFIEKTIDESLYPQIKEKATTIYSIFKNDENPERRRLAQWALTYFFDDEDLIHDNVSGIGLVDDMIIIDYAITLLCG